VEGNGITQNRGTVPIFVWSDRGISRKFPVAIVVVLADIRSGALPESGLRSFTDSANAVQCARSIKPKFTIFYLIVYHIFL
jgi:hypothetical protein